MTWSDAARAPSSRSGASPGDLRRDVLQDLRRARELSQAQLAEALGEKQPNISQLEQRTDMYVRTLRKYIEAMGGELEIIAKVPEGSVRITQFSEM